MSASPSSASKGINRVTAELRAQVNRPSVDDVDGGWENRSSRPVAGLDAASDTDTGVRSNSTQDIDVTICSGVAARAREPNRRQHGGHRARKAASDSTSVAKTSSAFHVTGIIAGHRRRCRFRQLRTRVGSWPVRRRATPAWVLAATSQSTGVRSGTVPARLVPAPGVGLGARTTDAGWPARGDSRQSLV